MWLAGVLCSTWPSAETCDTVGVMLCAGAPPTKHKGQDMPEALLVVTVPSSVSTTLCMPAPEQTTSSDCGLTSGDATATPSVNANQSRAKRASQGEERRKWRSDIAADYCIARSVLGASFLSKRVICRTFGPLSCGPCRL